MLSGNFFCMLSGNFSWIVWHMLLSVISCELMFAHVCFEFLDYFSCFFFSHNAKASGKKSRNYSQRNHRQLWKNRKRLAKKLVKKRVAKVKKNHHPTQKPKLKPKTIAIIAHSHGKLNVTPKISFDAFYARSHSIWIVFAKACTAASTYAETATRNIHPVRKVELTMSFEISQIFLFFSFIFKFSNFQHFSISFQLFVNNWYLKRTNKTK